MSLEEMLNGGLSLAEIGRRCGKHEATVAYWVEKHGLRAANRDKHAARGGLSREDLEPLVAKGASLAEIAAAVGRSKATVRYWLREYGLRTERASRRDVSPAQLATGTPSDRATLSCPRHGLTVFQRRSDGGSRCLKCRSEAVARRRRKVKEILVEESGGCCQACGYDRCVAALEFHHVEPSEKRFALSHRGVARSLERARAEAEKCVLLCANCHAEVEAGVRSLA